METFTWQRFGKDICSVPLRVYMVHLNNSSNNSFPASVICNGIMLLLKGAGRERGVIAEVRGSIGHIYGSRGPIEAPQEPI